MKWRTKKREEPPKVAPAFGDMRSETVFAWKPVRCDDGYMRWLERVTIVRVFQFVGLMGGIRVGAWEVISVLPPPRAGGYLPPPAPWPRPPEYGYSPKQPARPPAGPAPPPPPTPNRKTTLLGFPVLEANTESPDIELGPPNFIGIENMRDLDEPRGGNEAIRDLICACRSALLWLDFYVGARGAFLKIQLREAIEKAGGYVPPPMPHGEKEP